MIKSLNLKFGNAPNFPPVSVLTTPITVFVGPNNSGKSKVLAEINRFCTTGNTDPSDVIVDKIDFEPFHPEVVEEKIRQVTLKPNPGEFIQPDCVLVGKRGGRTQVAKKQLIDLLLNPHSQTSQFCQWYLTYNTLILDGRNRINLVNQQNGGDLQQSPQTSFQVLFRDDSKRNEVRRIINEAFGLYFVIDPTNLGQLSVECHN